MALRSNLLFLALFAALAPSAQTKEARENFKSVQQEQVQRWFSKGDMYDWRNKKAPLKVIVCQDELFPERRLADYDSLPVVRDDSVFEARKFKNGNEWLPSYKVDKNYTKRLSDDYLKGWLEQTNYWLSYLTGNKFQLELEGIERVVTNYWNDSFNVQSGSAFTMIVHPTACKGGYYSGDGIFWINPLNLTYDKSDKNRCTIVPIHEILHSFLGPDHSPDTMSTISSPFTHIFLPKDEADFLGWPTVKPKRLEQLKL